MDLHPRKKKYSERIREDRLSPDGHIRHFWTKPNKTHCTRGRREALPVRRQGLNVGTRPDLAYTVAALRRRSARPGTDHRAFRYLAVSRGKEADVFRAALSHQ